MMSVSAGMSAGQAGNYFSKEDYYLKGAEKDTTLWLGEGAKALGLSGEVKEGDFRALCDGKDPRNREQIVAPKITKDKETGEKIETHRAGNDLTFSAPKSVSVAYAAGVEGIKEAHDEAVKAVMTHIEAHYSHHRSPEGVQNGALVAAKFDHATSRNIDPQLHSHVFVLNAVQDKEGNWKANEPKAIFQDQKALGKLYRQELAHQLKERGFEIQVENRSQMYVELKGVDSQLIEHFSSRREAIEAQVAAWKAEGKHANVPHAKLHEMAALETREAKKEVTREDVSNAFERGFAAVGTSRTEVKTTIEQAAKERLQQEKVEGKTPTAVEIVQLAAGILTDKEAVLDRAKLLDQAVQISGGEHSAKDLNSALDGQADGVHRLGQDIKGREFYSTAEMRVLEARNVEAVKDLAGTFKSATSEKEVNTFLARLEATEGIQLTAGQKAHVLNELTGEHGVAVTQGDPGTGKTFASKIVERFNAEVLQPQGKDHYTVNVAFTGKAAKEMSAASGRPSFTIDSFLNAHANGNVYVQAPEQSSPAKEGELAIPHGAQVVLKVDEVSFVGARQAEHLLNIVKDLQVQGVQAKLQLTGDTKQMQAIQAGDLFNQVQDVAKDGKADFAHLSEINRQKDQGLLEIAKTLNRDNGKLGDNAQEALAALQDRGAVTERENRNELVAVAVERYMSASNALSHDKDKAAAGEKQSVLLVTATNADRHELNGRIRETRVAAGEIEEGKTFEVLTPAQQGPTADSYKEGQTVVFSGVRGEDGKMQAWGARLYTEGIIVGTNLEKNTVTVNYSFQTKDKNGQPVTRVVPREFSASDMANKTTTYNREERQFAAGDRIVALKNDKTLSLQNGSLGVIKELGEDGKAVVEFDGKETALDLNQYKNLDHAYAVTIHKSQGATVEHAIMFANVKPEKGKEEMAEGYGRASYNALNVAVTRAQYEAEIITNSISGLNKAVENVDTKTSTLNEIYGNKETPPSIESTRNEIGTAEASGGAMLLRSSNREPARFTTSAERNGQDGWKARTGDTRDGLSLQISGAGVELERNSTRDGLLPGEKVTSTTRLLAGGGKADITTTRYGSHSFDRKGTVTRADGSKSTWKERGVNFGGIYRSSTRTEKDGDTIKITKSSTWGNVTKGTTRSIHAGGRIVETNWTMKHSLFGGKPTMEIQSSRVYMDEKLANKHHMNLMDRMIRGVATTVVEMKERDRIVKEQDERLKGVQSATPGAEQKPGQTFDRTTEQQTEPGQKNAQEEAKKAAEQQKDGEGKGQAGEDAKTAVKESEEQAQNLSQDQPDRQEQTDVAASPDEPGKHDREPMEMETDPERETVEAEGKEVASPEAAEPKPGETDGLEAEDAPADERSTEEIAPEELAEMKEEINEIGQDILQEIEEEMKSGEPVGKSSIEDLKAQIDELESAGTTAEVSALSAQLDELEQIGSEMIQAAEELAEEAVAQVRATVTETVEMVEMEL